MRKQQNSLMSLFHRFPLDLLIVILNVLLILFVTLYPFNFSVSGDISLRKLLNSFDNSSFFLDQINNLLLFMPMGFGMASILKRQDYKIFIKLLIVTALGMCLSGTVEILQSFIPSRTPTPADIMNNTVGGLIGLLCFYIWDSNSFSSALTRIENSRVGRSFKYANLMLFSYIVFAYLVTIPWQHTTKLHTWNHNFPLLIGNERTGDRPWQGDISHLAIADRKFSPGEIAQVLVDPHKLDSIRSSLVAVYQLNQNQKQIYQDATGTLSDLVWQGNLVPNQNIEKLETTITPNQWLESSQPVTQLNQRISASSQFTMIATVRAFDTAQTGPARIISLSGDPTHRNLTLGQEKTDLVLRLRTILSGQNGTDIQMNMPGVFIDNNSHNIIITYAQSKAKIYVDNIQNYLEFNLFELIPREQRFFLYGITFIPLGFYLALLTILSKLKRINNYFLIPSGILLPSLILEAALIHSSGKEVSMINILLGVFFTASMTLLLKLRKIMLD